MSATSEGGHFMEFRFTEEQEMMRQMVREFAAAEIAPFVERMEQGEFPRPILAKMAELGLMGITVPEQYGGAGMDFVSYIIAIHEISKVSPTVGVILSVHTSVGTNPILYFGTEEQKQKYVTKLARGEYLGAFCLTEPSAGSDAKSLKTKAVRRGDRYVLNGSKIFITNGGEADTYIVFARTNPEEAGSRGISAFIVEKGTPGMSIGKDEKKMGLHGSRTVTITFEDAEVPAENLLGQEGEGFKIAMANLDVGRIGIAAQALGIAEAAVEHAVVYAKERVQFGKPIIEQQASLSSLPIWRRRRKRRNGSSIAPLGCARKGCRAEKRRRWRSSSLHKQRWTMPSRRCKFSAATATRKTTRSSGCSVTRKLRKFTKERAKFSASSSANICARHADEPIRTR
ncbi:Acyl-CoA dehydrogenase, short-chain specific [Geobacillus sp. WSUCF1]|nr:Acyl-CoA dehydrogenase, short-chain specific [Geobacillus sp. WSUCF1]